MVFEFVSGPSVFNLAEDCPQSRTLKLNNTHRTQIRIDADEARMKSTSIDFGTGFGAGAFSVSTSFLFRLQLSWTRALVHA